MKLMEQGKPEISAMLGVSTAHISLKTNVLLENKLIDGLVMYEKEGYGWFLLIPDEEEDFDKLPVDLKQVFVFAREKGCEWVNLDRDAAQYENLLKYDWSAKKKMFQIVGNGQEDIIHQVIEIMKAHGLEVEIDTVDDFDDWLETLPDTTIKGFNDATKEWIRQWGNGGGDLSTEDQVKYCSSSDVPKEWAEDAYASISEYSKRPFEAARLIMVLVDEVIQDLTNESEINEEA